MVVNSTGDDSLFEIKLDTVAKKIVHLGLEVPLIFLLESNKPFSSMYHSAGVAFEPLGKQLLGDSRYDFLLNLLSARSRIEKLLLLIEHYSRLRSSLQKEALQKIPSIEGEPRGTF